MNECLENPNLIGNYLQTFDYKLQPLQTEVELVVIDVASGSDTRVMVK